ncbi:MAG: MarR family transcriptional regulator [Myxococcota bacterium]
MSSPHTHEHEIARLGGMLHQLMGLINKAAGAGTLEMMNTHQLTLPQMVALQVLRYEGPFSTLRLMDDLRLSASATSHLVERLVEKGWVTRRENADDRRQRQLEVTPAALEMLDQMAEQRAHELQVAFGKVDPETRARLADAFEQVITQLKTGGSS